MDVQGIFDDALVWDEHGGFEMLPGKPIAPMLTPWRDAGVDVLSVNVGYDLYPPETVLRAIAWIRRRLSEEAPFAVLAGTVDQIDAAVAAGRMTVTFDIEGMNVLAGQVDMVSMLYDLGVRHMNFAYNLNNQAGSGCHDDDTGLTDFGRQVIDEMNRVGMVIDCTHTGYRTTMEAMERSADPVIFSHSNPAALHGHGRNISDDQIRACAATGGVVGINGISLFHGTETVTPEHVARAVFRVAELTSIDHVGISLDYAPEFDQGDFHDFLRAIPNADLYWPADQGYGPGIGCLGIDRLPEIAASLAGMGLTEPDLRKVLGLNFRRVAAQVWKDPE